VKTLTASEALDRYFLEARCKLLDLAAILDRIHRGGLGDPIADPRLERLRQGLAILQDEEKAKAERVQQAFSLDYESSWEKPKPR